MQHRPFLRRSALFGATFFATAAITIAVAQTACAATRFEPTGVYAAYLSGRFAASQNQLDIAATEFLKTLRDDPGNHEVRLQAFLTAEMSGRSEAARLARELPGNEAAEMLLADIDASAGNWDSAVRRYAALPKKGMTQLLQPLLLAWAEAGSGDTDAALATLRPYRDDPRTSSIFALHAAMIADLAGRTPDADRFYAVARAGRDALNLREAQVLASWDVRQGHPAAAQATLSALARISDDVVLSLPALLRNAGTRPVATATDGLAEAYLEMAAALHAQDSNDSALLLLRLALDLRPDFTEAKLMTAEIDAPLGRNHAALDALSAIPANDPLNSVAQLRKALVADRLGSTKQAIAILDTLARDYPDLPQPLRAKGDVLRADGDYAAAVAAYDQAIARIGEAGPNDWGLYYSRAVALDRAHQWDRAEADFEHALKLAPNQPYVLNYLGYAWAEQGHNLPRARSMIEKAVAERPNDGNLVDSLGWVKLRQGDTAGAVFDLEHAAELEPEDSTINGHLGDAYWAAGRKREAEFQWRRALSLNPQAEDAAKLEAKLQTPPDTPQPAAAGMAQGISLQRPVQ